MSRLARSEDEAARASLLKALSKKISVANSELEVPCFGPDVPKRDWVLPNRGEFTNWIDGSFSSKHGSLRHRPTTRCGQELNVHQSFVKDYLQFSSPYRGLLLYHGLGSGKSCSSIVAAESLRSEMDVVVMLPASLKANYIDEVKKYGSDYYSKAGLWRFESVAGYKTAQMKEVSIASTVDLKMLKKHTGLWLKVEKRGRAFDSLSPEGQGQIEAQTSHIIQKRYTFIHYNGLTIKKLKELATDSDGNEVNIFSNKCVIVDEVHRLVSYIANGTGLGSPIYQMLLDAKNCKIVLLSGTPIINRPFEVAIIVNILRGLSRQYTISLDHTRFDDTGLSSHPSIDEYTVDAANNKLRFTTFPPGFIGTETTPSRLHRLPRRMVSRDPHPGPIADGRTEVERVEVILHDLKHARGVPVTDTSLKASNTKQRLSRPPNSVRLTRCLPDTHESFNDMFIDTASNAVMNGSLFMRRIAGCVSYYASKTPGMYPAVTTSDVHLDITAEQFERYLEAREKEMKLELKQQNQDEGAVHEDGQASYYRAFSRAICNFAFPAEVPRPMSSEKNMRQQMGDFDSEADGEVASISDEPTTYMKRLSMAMHRLTSDENLNYLDSRHLHKYSPKFDTIIRNLRSSGGPAMVYSQFRVGEGIGLLALSMNQNGWVQLKIHQDGDRIWRYDDEEVLKSTMQRYIIFTDDAENTRMLLKIYNSRDVVSDLPSSLSAPLERYTSNASGDILRALLITASAAEGISLKGVRQVHIIEPYWNTVRTQQVIGRAVRMYSHSDLPKADQRVDVFNYVMKFTDAQLEDQPTLQNIDKSMTADEILRAGALRKAKVTDELLILLQRAAVDCVVNGNVGCFEIPANTPPDHIMYEFDIADDVQDRRMLDRTVPSRWTGVYYRTKDHNYIVDPSNGAVYDYDSYTLSGRLVRLDHVRFAKSATPEVRPPVAFLSNHR